jgi:hypothetical protein
MTVQSAPKLPAPKPHSMYTHLFGRTVAVNVDTTPPGGEEDFRTIEGKVIDVSDTRLAIKVRNKVEIVPIKKIIGEVEIQSSTSKSKVSIRKIKQPGSATRAHLAMRHGIVVPLMNSVSEGVAAEMHSKIDHGPLGHRHVGDPDPVDEAEGGKRIRSRHVNDENRSIRQHMADRHGHRVGVLEALADADIRTLHDHISHDNLGHRHEELQRRRSAKKVVTTAIVVTPRRIEPLEEFPLDILD